MQADIARRDNALSLPGFDVLLGKELDEASRSRRLIAFLGIMSLLVALFPLIGYARIDDFGDGFRSRISDDDMNGMVMGWVGMVGYLGSLMVIASTVDAVTRERALGITAWIITKPVSRLSYLLAIAVGHTIASVLTVILVPAAVWTVLTVALFEDVPLGRVLGSVGILCIEVAFLCFLNVALGVLFRSVTWVAIFSLAIWFAPTIVPAIATLEWMVYVLPSYLPIMAIALIDVGYSERAFATVPLSATIIGAAVFAAGVWLFEQQEL